MNNIKFLVIFFSVAVLIESIDLYAQDSTAVQTKANKVHNKEFVDKNGDGYNDNAPDHDGDGIPNGLDPDFKRMKKRMRNAEMPYVDLNGDGINDNLQMKGKGNKMRMNRMNENVNPQDGGNSSSTSGNDEKQKGKGKGGKK